MTNLIKNIWKWQSQNRRPNWDELFMMIAEIAATRSTCDRGPDQRFRDHKGTGTVIVSQDHRHIAIGYNGSPPNQPHCDDADHQLIDNHCKRVVHSECNAILNATFELSGCTLYTTTFPCYDCAKLISSVGITKVVFQHDYVHAKEVFDLLKYDVLIYKLDMDIAKLIQIRSHFYHVGLCESKRKQ